MKYKKNVKRKSIVNEEALSNHILGVFTNEPRKTFNYKQLAKLLLIKSGPEKVLLNTLLHKLSNAGYLEELSPGKYKLKATGGNIVGKIQITQGGYGFVVSDEIEEDVFVSQKNLHKALNGDIVKIYLFARKKKLNPEGEVVQIIERARETFVGVLEILERYAFCIPDSRQMPYDIFIPLEKLGGAKNGQKVITRIYDWPEKAKNPFGEVIEILGMPGENDTEMHAILAEFGLPNKFSEEVEQDAEQISELITEEDIAERRDFRKITTFTIDPADAKDFDDALSFQKLPNGNWEVGVHIADVTHYIRPKTILEEEALARATSIYLVDRVVPMLPERLSNFLCSLRPNEEKLCFSAVFELDDKAELLNEWFGKTIIYSDRRFAYEEAQHVIDTGEGDLKEEILKLNQLAQTLRSKRFMDGAISFERDEVKFEIDENGKPLGIKFREHGTANELIEEFMLLANRRVAEFVGNVPNKKERKTFVYRIHDKPNQEKLQKFASFVRKFGHNIMFTQGDTISTTLNTILSEVKGKPEQNIIETLAVRSMAKAAYSTDNIGHYGLSFKHYTHFTSPIRRYPDMMVHRMLFDYLKGEESKSKKKYEARCRHASEMEQLAVDAERASIKYKQVEFMQDKTGKVFDGIISGVTEFGLFVEIIENKCEGLVATRDMQDDFYEYDEDNYCLNGRHTGKTYQLGDPVKIEVLRANLSRKQLDFALASGDDKSAEEEK
ncbi:MAG: ribonuclease R [Bacteroidales bacterium]|nr:ribonuclease R [Bacteroidales bacterium]